jgi:hypothetical protein
MADRVLTIGEPSKLSMRQASPPVAMKSVLPYLHSVRCVRSQLSDRVRNIAAEASKFSSLAPSIERALMLAYLLAAPFVFSRDTFDPVQVPRFLLLVGLLWVWLLFRLVRGNTIALSNDFRILHHPVVISSGIYAGLCLISSYNSINFGEAFSTFCGWQRPRFCS